jgi:hypothetical protein
MQTSWGISFGMLKCKISKLVYNGSRMNQTNKSLNPKIVFASLFFCLFFASFSNVFASVKLARLFSDHTVLQRQKPIPVWGWANPDETVSVSLAGQNVVAKADSSGKFNAVFTTLEACGEVD